MATTAACQDGTRADAPARAAGPPGRRNDLLLLAAMVLLYLPLVFIGYGTDNDTFLVLDSGRQLINEHTYVPSRNPGYLLYEAAVGVLDRVGGPVLSNAATLASAAAALWCFLQICRHLDVPRPHLLGMLLVIHPVFWTSAACTMDYVWALALLLAGCLLLLRRAYLAAGVVLGLSVGMRSTSCIAAGLFLVFALAGRPADRRRVVLAGVVAVALGALCYLPSFRHAGYTLSFLTPLIGGEELWTPGLRLARFGYKNIYFWGPVAAMLLPALLLLVRRGLSDPRRRSLVACCLAVAAAYEALFLAYPIDLPYLLPFLPAVLILLGVALAQQPGLLAAFGVALASYAVLNVNIARPDHPGRATGGTVGLWLEPGLVLQNVRERAELRHCRTNAEWMTATGQATGQGRR
jgi:hypothetical protein